jgi:anaerobic selenocysteine-containing dehydrogenase
MEEDMIGDGGRSSTVERKSFCRTCLTHCGMIVSVDEHEQIVAIRPDKDDPTTQGFACFKGLIAPEAHAGANRILYPLKRQPDGSFKRIDLEQALDEIADKISQIVKRDGAEAVGGYRGSGAGMNGWACFLLDSFIQAVGSPKVFSAITIDQSAKIVCAERMGVWPPGQHPLQACDVKLMFGTNPLVSYYALDGHNSPKKIQELIEKGLKLLVVDPRRTETAKLAHRFLQPLPGEDVTIAAGMIRHILDQGLEDKEFLMRHGAQIDALRAAVEPFTPSYVARRADVSEEDFVSITETFARAQRGAAWSGTGPSMSPRSNLAEHLVQCLNVICGRFVREGERIANPGVLRQSAPARCQVIPAQRSYDKGYKSRVGDFGIMKGLVPEMPTVIIPAEILQPGPGQIRAFVVHGGNLGLVAPDQRKVTEALRSLELLVTIDPYMTATGKSSHYIIPSVLQYERSDLPCWQAEGSVYTEPYMRYTPAVAKPPAGSEIYDEAFIFWGLAKRLGLQLTYLGVALDMSMPVTPDSLLDIVARHSPVSLAELRNMPLGCKVDITPQFAVAGNPGPEDKFSLMPDDILEEMSEVAGEDFDRDIIASNGVRATHRFSVRRQRNMWNSTGRELPSTRRRVPYNRAFVNPEDLSAHNIKSGDFIRISSEHATIEAIAEADESVRPGVVSMAHGYGTVPEDDDYARHGASVNMLISAHPDRIEKINAMAHMSGFPVAISPADRRNSPLTE